MNSIDQTKLDQIKQDIFDCINCNDRIKTTLKNVQQHANEISIKHDAALMYFDEAVDKLKSGREIDIVGLLKEFKDAIVTDENAMLTALRSIDGIFGELERSEEKLHEIEETVAEQSDIMTDREKK